LDEIDSFIPEPQLDTEKPFLIPIQGVYSLAVRGTMVMGYVERGIIKVGDELKRVGFQQTFKTVCKGLNRSRKLSIIGHAGDNIGILLGGTKRDEVKRGQVVAAPGSISPHINFKAEIYLLNKEEGGRHVPLFSEHKPWLYFRTTEVAGSLTLPDNLAMVMPGDNAPTEVRLETSIAMEKGLQFDILEGGRTISVGIVAEIIE
jgi:elongation factor Tu